MTVTFYPHGALREIDQHVTAQSTNGDSDSVTVRARGLSLVPRDLNAIHTTDPLRFDDSNRFNSEGFSPLDLAEYCTSVSFTESLSGTYGGADITLELPFADALKLLGGVVAGAQRHLLRDNTALTLRNLCTGGWVVIKQATAAGDLVGRFFGQVTRVSNRLAYGADGKPLRVVNITADNFYAGFMRNQLKQTMSRDDNLKEIEPSAVFRAADYRDGFLKAIKDSFKAQAPAVILNQVIQALGGHKLPASLVRFADMPVSTFIFVCDGSFDDMQKYGLKGADVDVIKGKIMSLFQGATSNNVTHHEVIMQMFNALPQLFEYFALFVPMTPRELSKSHRSGTFKRLGGVPLIIYRYKPVYPYAPPSASGFNALTRFKYGVDSKVQSKTACESFFGDMPPVRAGDGQSYMIDSTHLTALEYGVSEDDRINFTFVEGAFSSAQGHALNYFRNDASPAINKTDINRHGLRAQSMHTPFVSVDSDPDEIKAFNMRAPNALAERLFHNIAMGHTFTAGTFRVEHDIAARHLLNARAALHCVPVGNWVTFKLPISEAADPLYTCYIEAVTTAVSADVLGIVTSVSTYQFTRGHIGVHAPEFDTDKYEAESLTLLMTNDDVSQA
jgi:hypothetical protein